MSPYSLGLALATGAVASIGVGTNTYTYYYIKKTFYTKQSLYFALKIDSLMTSVSTLATFLLTLVSVTNVQIGEVGCFALSYLSMTGFFLNPFLTFILSYVR